LPRRDLPMRAVVAIEMIVEIVDGGFRLNQANPMPITSPGSARSGCRPVAPAA